jgi:DNA modification methylase
MDYGRDYDFSKPFFTHFLELLRSVPLKNMNIVAGTSSPYTFNITDPKNCYLVFNASYVEDCMYEKAMRRCTKIGDYILDCFGGSGSQLIAAEQLKRKALLVEKDPTFVDLILLRYEQLTGIKPVKLS